MKDQSNFQTMNCDGCCCDKCTCPCCNCCRCYRAEYAKVSWEDYYNNESCKTEED